ncbi:MAG: glutathione S-transferase family protein, partial [Pseudomonadota bacterium]
MPDFILHHHDPSPFAEKIRLIFGLKDLHWGSVQIPMIMPKPDLTALTGGYRKTPVVQCDADVYIDSLLISQEIDRRCPNPPLFPGKMRGLTLALSRWSDKAFFEPGAALSMGENPQVPDAVIEDRKNFFNFMDFSKLSESLPAARFQLQAQLAILESALTGCDYLDGDSPGYTDVLGWFPVWMVRNNVPSADTLLAPFANIAAWSERMTTIGHGKREDIDASGAIERASASTPSDAGVVDDNPFALSRGDRVVVFADDYGKDEMEGELLHLDHHKITIRRHDDRTGAVNLHAPASGFL